MLFNHSPSHLLPLWGAKIAPLHAFLRELIPDYINIGAVVGVIILLVAAYLVAWMYVKNPNG